MESVECPTGCLILKCGILDSEKDRNQMIFIETCVYNLFSREFNFFLIHICGILNYNFTHISTHNISKRQTIVTDIRSGSYLHNERIFEELVAEIKNWKI